MNKKAKTTKDERRAANVAAWARNQSREWAGEFRASKEVVPRSNTPANRAHIAEHCAPGFIVTANKMVDQLDGPGYAAIVAFDKRAPKVRKQLTANPLLTEYPDVPICHMAFASRSKDRLLAQLNEILNCFAPARERTEVMDIFGLDMLPVAMVGDGGTTMIGVIDWRR